MHKAKLKLIPLFALLSLISINLSAQVLTTELGAHQTSFRISTDSMALVVEDQLLIKRAYKDYFYDGDFNSANGMAFQTWHFEFISRQPIQIQKVKGKKKNFILLGLYDRRNDCIGQFDLALSRVKGISSPSKEKLYTYSLNLIDIPLVLLERTRRIDLLQIQ